MSMNVSTGYFLFYFALGLVLPVPWLYWIHRFDDRRLTIGIGSGLIVAALIYIGFALYQGDYQWLAVEFIGVFFYGLFVWLALNNSLLWLAVGWGLHPVWDAALHWLGPGVHIVPSWYAIACLSFDLAVAAYVVYRVSISKKKLLAPN